MSAAAIFGILSHKNEYMASERNKIALLWVGSLFIFIVTLLLVYFKMHDAPETIALRYNVIIGVVEIGSRYELLKIPITGLLITIVNYILARMQKFDKTFLPFIAGLVSVTVNALLFIAALFLYQVS